MVTSLVGGGHAIPVRLCSNTRDLLVKFNGGRAEKITRDAVERRFGRAVLEAVLHVPCTWVEVDNDPRAEAVLPTDNPHRSIYAGVTSWDDPHCPRPHRFTIQRKTLNDDVYILGKADLYNARIIERGDVMVIDVPNWERISFISALMDRRFTYRERLAPVPPLQQITTPVRTLNPAAWPQGSFDPRPAA